MVKTITITEEAYDALAKKKESNSFSETILVLTGEESGKPKLRDFLGILSPGAGEKLRRRTREIRDKANKDYAERMKHVRSRHVGRHRNSRQYGQRQSNS